MAAHGGICTRPLRARWLRRACVRSAGASSRAALVCISCSRSACVLTYLEVCELLQRAHHRRMVPGLPPWAAQALNSSCAVAVLGSDTPSARALVSARFRSFWCSSMRKPGSNVRLIMRSPCTSRIARGGEAAHQRLAHLAGIGAGPGGEQQRLGHRLDVQGDDDLVGDLGGLAVAVAAHERDVLAHQLEQRLDARRMPPGAADHDGQRARPWRRPRRRTPAHRDIRSRAALMRRAKLLVAIGEIELMSMTILPLRQSLSDAVLAEQHLSRRPACRAPW